MKSGGVAHAHFSRPTVLGLCLVGTALILTSCASRPPHSAAETGAVGKAKTRGFETPSSTTPAAATQTQQIALPKGDRAADRIVAQVEGGRLSQAGESYLVFVRSSSATPKPTPSLYGDAIALARLRSKVKAVPGAPDSASNQASVHNGAAVIPIKDSISASITAAIVDASLSVDLVRSVRINLPTAPR